jgi:hypothetical protein
MQYNSQIYMGGKYREVELRAGLAVFSFRAPPTIHYFDTLMS